MKQLDDISFSDSDEEKPEDIKSLKRLPKTVLTEEALRAYLGPETERINLEHHYWIKDNFIDKIGRMAPNIRELSLRRMNLTNRAFTCIAAELKDLRKIDISYCPNIHVSGFKILIDNNKYLSHIQVSNSSDAVNNEIV